MASMDQYLQGGLPSVGLVTITPEDESGQVASSLAATISHNAKDHNIRQMIVHIGGYDYNYPMHDYDNKSEPTTYVTEFNAGLDFQDVVGGMVTWLTTSPNPVDLIIFDSAYYLASDDYLKDLAILSQAIDICTIIWITGPPYARTGRVPGEQILKKYASMMLRVSEEEISCVLNRTGDLFTIGRKK